MSDFGESEKHELTLLCSIKDPHPYAAGIIGCCTLSLRSWIHIIKIWEAWKGRMIYSTNGKVGKLSRLEFIFNQDYQSNLEWLITCEASARLWQEDSLLLHMYYCMWSYESGRCQVWSLTCIKTCLTEMISNLHFKSQLPRNSTCSTAVSNIIVNMWDFTPQSYSRFF